MVYKFYLKKTSGSGIKKKNISEQQLAEELHKPIIRNFKKGKVHSSFIDNIWGSDLADMELITKFNKGVDFLLCVIDIYSKYGWVIYLKDEKGISITSDFQRILDKSIRKLNKRWVDKGSEFYNRTKKSWIERNDIEIYSTHSEGKPAVAKRFIRVLKNKNYKYMASLSKNLDKLGDILNKYNNTYHAKIKKKPVALKLSTYLDSSTEINNKDPKFKTDDIVRISKYKNIFTKSYVPNWSEEVLVIKKVENSVCGHMLLLILKTRKLSKHFTKRNCKKQIDKSLELKK